MFSVGQFVTVKRSFINDQLAYSAQTPNLSQTLSILGLLGGDGVVLRIAALGTANDGPNIDAFQTIQLVPINQFHPFYHGGTGVTVYFTSLSDLNNSFNLSTAFLDEVQQNRVINGSGAPILRGQVVRYASFNLTNQLPSVSLASAASSSTASCLGIADQDLQDGELGSITTVASFTQLNTSGFSQLNDFVYLSDTPGAISPTPGTNPVVVGRVTAIDSSLGSIFVFGIYGGGSSGGGGGSTGLTGATGISGGPPGATGLTGVTGISGGPQGATGISGGPQGATGIRGVTGIGGGGSSVSSGVLTVTDGQTSLPLPTPPTSQSTTFLFINTATYTAPTHFTLSGSTITWLNSFLLQSTDLVVYEYF